MDRIRLRPVSEGYARAIEEYRAEFPDGGEQATPDPGRIPGLDGLEDFADAREWLCRCADEAGRIDRFLAVRERDGRIVGALTLRHRLEYDDDDIEFASHIGYSVRPSERRKGYAREQLRLALCEAEKSGIGTVRVICRDTNAGSIATIRANGGVYVDSLYGEGSGMTVYRWDIPTNAVKRFARLETERLVLRKAEERDLAAMRRNVWGDVELARYMLWTPAQTDEDARANMRKAVAVQNAGLAYFVCRKENDEPIGFAGVHETDDGVYEDSGICIARAYQGKGYGKEVLNALSDLALRRLGGRRFVYGCFHENERSAALCRACGFVYSHSENEVRKRDGLEYVSDYYVLERNGD